MTLFAPEGTTEVAMEVTTEVRRMLGVLGGEMSRQDLQDALGLKNSEHFRKACLVSAIKEKLIEMTLPDKPNSSKQRSRLAAIGRSLQGGDSR